MRMAREVTERAVVSMEASFVYHFVPPWRKQSRLWLPCEEI